MIIRQGLEGIGWTKTHLDVPGPGSERINGEVGSMGYYNLLINGLCWGYNPLNY